MLDELIAMDMEKALGLARRIEFSCDGVETARFGVWAFFQRSAAIDSVGASFAKAVKSEADPYADTKVAEDDGAVDVCCAVCIVCFHTF